MAQIKIDIPEELRNIDFEYNAILYFVSNQELLADYLNKLQPKHFNSKGCRLVYEYLLENYISGKTVGKIQIERHLSKVNEPSDWLHTSCSIKNTAELKNVVSDLQDLFERRSKYVALQKASVELIRETPISKVVATTVSALGKDGISKRSAGLKEIMSELHESIDAIRNGKRLKTGWDMLDLISPGYVAGHLWIIGAFTGTGKSWYALQAVKNIVEQKGNVVLFSTEMQSFENLGRILGMETGQGYQNMWQGINDPKLLEDPQISKWIEKADPHLKIYDDLRTIKEIATEIRSLLFKQTVDVVVIDFIQNIDIGNKDVYAAFKEIAQEVQMITKDLKITTLLTSQLSNSYAKNASRDNFVEYKNAGELAAVADVGIILVDQTQKYKEVMLRKEFKMRGANNKAILLDMKKSRHTGGGRIPMILEFPSGRMVEAPPQNNWINETIRDDWYQSQEQTQAIHANYMEKDDDDDFIFLENI